MRNTLLKLQKKIPKNISEVLRLVFQTAQELNIQAFVIGATARDLIFEYVHQAEIQRATVDVDFAVAVGSWDEYEKLRKSLIETGKFKNDNGVEQRIWWKSEPYEMKIDLVPYGEIESPAGEIAFPPDEDFVMNTSGFAEAFESSLNLKINDDLTIKVVSLAGLALLKFIAYNDRPQERRRDLQDIFFIAENYLEADNEKRLFDENATDADLLRDEDFDYRTCGARLLGRDIVPILNEQTQKIVLKILSDNEEGGKLQNFADVIYRSSLQDDERYDAILELLRQLKRGIDERL